LEGLRATLIELVVHFARSHLAILSSIARNRCPNRLLRPHPAGPAINRKHREQISFLLWRLYLWMNSDFVRSD
jgi:hypothetical protein